MSIMDMQPQPYGVAPDATEPEDATPPPEPAPEGEDGSGGSSTPTAPTQAPEDDSHDDGQHGGEQGEEGQPEQAAEPQHAEPQHPHGEPHRPADGPAAVAAASHLPDAARVPDAGSLEAAAAAVTDAEGEPLVVPDGGPIADAQPQPISRDGDPDLAEFLAGDTSLSEGAQAKAQAEDAQVEQSEAAATTTGKSRRGGKAADTTPAPQV